MRAFLIAAALSLAFPAAGAAKLRPYIPPGNSGANEYVESVPTAGGSNATGNVIESGGGSALAPGTQSALARQGRDGRATAAVANETAPRNLRHRFRRHVGPSVTGGSTGSGSPGAGTSPEAGGSPAGAVLKSLFGLQGQGGAALPAILILAALVLGAERMWRRRAS